MVLFFTALQEQKKIKVFSFQPDQLEFGLDLINIFNAQGNVILSAHIVDANGATEIPLDVFDGNPFAAPIQSLEKEWKKLLKKPIKQASNQHTQALVIDAPMERTQRRIDLSQHTNERIDILGKQVQIYKKYIDNLNSTINQMEELVKQARRFSNSHSAERYKMLINQYKERITKAQNKLKLSLDKLQQLQYK